MNSNLEKIIWPPAGKYVLAVSGGIDSAVLLDILAADRKKRKYEIIVAHFNHGIRGDSSKDEALVKKLADSYGLEFVSAGGHLGKAASEAKARDARYKFLRQICKKYRANKIITAHHLDDRIETALFNLQRGTGRRGLIPFSQDSDIIRPLKNVYKSEILEYTAEHKLDWREDSTNKDLKFSRNAIRRKLIPELEAAEPDFKKQFAQLLFDLEGDNKKIVSMLENKLQSIGIVHSNSIVLNRGELILMSQNVLKEFLYYSVLKLDPTAEVLSPQLERLAHYCKTARPGTSCPISGTLAAETTVETITLTKSGPKA